MGKEALDSVKDERAFAGVHILATALLCAAGASADELELARRILERDPKRDAPRESESVAGAFNRHMDAAIDSVNDSVDQATRAARRALLARDLDRAGLVLVDRAAIASLIATVAELRAELARVDGEDLGAELVADEDPCSNPHCDDLDSCTVCGKGIAVDMRPGGLTYDAIDDRGHIKPAVAKAIEEARNGPRHYAPAAVVTPEANDQLDAMLNAEPCCLEAPRSQPNCPCAGEHDGNGGSYDGLEFIGLDRGAEFNPTVND